ncbi:acyl-CoA synthetase [Acuticoccus sediminis]|uniref:3-methylmercaptopropionyl-CoA ligase n=1 Tax=Acuticoccus sediminis TaxID=2184697 RepID=A0A8B2NSN6_9HYPH|nr:acyl-CoA synthetase [Acuticoccus sediminis]RAH99289.1 acyl-CoA synthetase [Acuticoccus sediminis]
MERSETGGTGSPGGAAGGLPVSRRVANLSYILRQNARRFGGEIGFVWGDDTWTWSEMERRVDAMAAALRARGVSKGDRILVQSKNCNQMFESMFATFRVGAVWVPTNYRQTPDEVAYLATASGARALICHAAFPDHAAAVRAAAPAIDIAISIGPSDFAEDYDAIVARHLGETGPLADVEYDDPCWFFFTSGTTGRPKAAVLTHGQMAFIVTNHLCDLMPGTTSADASLVVAPLSHGAGVNQLVLAARGAKSILMPGERLDVEEAWRLVETWRVTNIFTVPTIVKILTEHPAVDTYDHSSLKVVIYAGAPMYREDQKYALAKLGKVMVQYFGLGEVTGCITVLPQALHEAEDGPGVKVGTCGFERTGMQLTIQDAAGNELPAGASGDICVTGPGVFAGYYNNPEANAKSFRNGWFVTGDIGYVDAEGFLYITGRASDMYISGGSNVYPREIEELLLTHPTVKEVAIIGIPHPKWGEVGLAVVIAAEGETLSEAALAAHLDGKLARYKLPARYVFLDEMPKTGYGKIAKKLVRETLEAKGLLGTEPARA